MSKLEKAEENKVKDWCKKHSVLFIKFTPLGERGWPDRIAVFPGGFQMWVEMKRKGEVPRKLQFFRMEQLNNKGVIAAWFDNADDCIDYFEDCLMAAQEITNGQAVDTPPVPAKRDRNISQTVRSRSVAGSGNGEDSNFFGGIRCTQDSGNGQDDAGGGAD